MLKNFEKVVKHFTAHGCHHGCDMNRETIRLAFREIRNQALEEAAEIAEGQYEYETRLPSFDGRPWPEVDVKETISYRAGQRIRDIYAEQTSATSERNDG